LLSYLATITRAGGETIKQINMQSGAHAEILRNPPPGSDMEFKTFVIKGN